MIALDHSIFSLQASGGISRWWLMHSLSMTRKYGHDVHHIGPYANRNIHLEEAPRNCLPAAAGRLPLHWLWAPATVPEGARIFHSSYLRVCRDDPRVAMVFTFHDDFWLSGRSWKCQIKKACIVRCLKRARIIHCVSAFSKARLMQRFPSTPEHRIRVVHHGVTPPAGPPNAAMLPVSGDIALWVGNRHLYKNGPLAFEAAALSAGLQLVCVGGEPLSPTEQARIRELGLGERFHHYPRASGAELSWLYSRAVALWYPSLLEGFGLPVIEAAAHGCPVLATAGHAVEEIGKGWPILANHPTAQWLASETETLRRDRTLRARLASQGVELARSYTWTRYAAEMADIYAEAEASS